MGAGGRGGLLDQHNGVPKPEAIRPRSARLGQRRQANGLRLCRNARPLCAHGGGRLEHWLESPPPPPPGFALKGRGGNGGYSRAVVEQSQGM